MLILLATERADLRLSIELLLSEEPGVIIVGAASETEGMLALLDNTHPDLLIVEWDLPGRRLAEIVPQIRANTPCIHILALGNESSLLDAALKAGADDYVVKGDPPEQLLETFRHARSHHKSETISPSPLEE